MVQSVAHIPIKTAAGAGPVARAELADVDHLLRCHGARVQRFIAFSLQDSDAAASLTQDCFLKAWRTRNQFRGDCSVHTWLLRIATNLVRDHVGTGKFRFWRQTNAARVDVAEVSERIASQQATAEQQMLARERLRQVHSAVAQLTERQRTVFLLRFVEELDIEEICAATGMPVGTVKSHLHRALVAVRAADSNQGARQ